MNEVMTLLAKVSAQTEASKKAKANLQREFAPNFNPVELMAPGETRLSEVIRWMLDETESHGQGCAFRDQFVTDILQNEPSDWERASVACEVGTEHEYGRIDILMISADQKRRLAIENKPWAGWQKEQLARYLRDQTNYDCDVTVLALIGSADPKNALESHWRENDNGPCPDNVKAFDFHSVADWIEKSAAIARPTRVRDFLFAVAEYCRRYVMNEPADAEIEETATLMRNAGPEILNAAIKISNALPLALTQHIATLVGGTVDKVNGMNVVRYEVDGTPMNFVLFGLNRPWAGLTEKSFVGRLSETLPWARPDSSWHGWNYINNLGDEGAALAGALANQDLERVAALLPALAKVMIDAPSAKAQSTGGLDR